MTNLIVLNDIAIASASVDNMVKVWNWKDGACLKTLWGHTKSVYGIAAIERKKIVSSSNDCKIIVWK